MQEEERKRNREKPPAGSFLKWPKWLWMDEAKATLVVHQWDLPGRHQQPKHLIHLPLLSQAHKQRADSEVAQPGLTKVIRWEFGQSYDIFYKELEHNYCFKVSLLSYYAF